MDFSCGQCMNVWYCSSCKNRYCDDASSPYMHKGKPTQNNMGDVKNNNEYFNDPLDSAKEKKKENTKIFRRTPICFNVLLV